MGFLDLGYYHGSYISVGVTLCLCCHMDLREVIQMIDLIEELAAALGKSDADCANKEDRIKELESALKQIADNCPFPAGVARKVLEDE